MTKDLTKIEKKFARKFDEEDGIKHDPKHINVKFIREIMQSTAYHEAGHFAARAFTRLELNYISSISIIPNGKNMGIVRYYLAPTEGNLHRTSLAVRRSKGYMLLLEMFAGYGAQMIYEKSEYELLLDYICDEPYATWDDYSYCADYEDRSKNSDITRAQRIADLISSPHYNKDRILIIAFKWTLEMLRIPSVWNLVETTAKVLLSKGEVTLGNREISKLIYDPNFTTIYDIPKWKKRIAVKKG